MLVPMLEVTAAAVRVGRPGTGSGLTLDHLGTAVTLLRSSDLAGTTVAFVVGAAVIAVGLGTWLAWLTERTDLPGRRLVYALVAVPLVVPGVLTTSAWRLLLAERIGVVNALLAAVGLESIRTDPHTLGAMIWVAGTDGLTLPFLLVAVALRHLDPTLEEAALVAGGRRAAVARIVLPLAAPGLAAAVLVTLIRLLGDFEGPVMLGLPGGVRVLSSQTYLLVRTFPTDANLAAAFAVVLLVPSLLGLLVYLHVTRGAGRFASIAGRPRGAVRRPLRRPRIAATAVFGTLGVVVLLPLAVLAYASLLPYYAPPLPTAPPPFTLRNFAAIVDAGPVLARTLRNTLVAVSMAAVLAVLLGGLAARASARRSDWSASVLDPVATMPLALPGVVLGLALLWVYVRLPVPLYGTLLGVAVGLAVFSTPYTTRVVHASLLRVAPELEAASAVAGAGPVRTAWRVVLPLAVPGIAAATLFAMVRSTQILSVPLLVGGPGDEVLSVLLYSLYEAGRIPEASALGIAMVVVLLVLTLLAEVLGRRWTQHADATRSPREVVG